MGRSFQNLSRYWSHSVLTSLSVWVVPLNISVKVDLSLPLPTSFFFITSPLVFSPVPPSQIKSYDWQCLDLLSIFTWTLWDRIPFMSYNQWCFALNINNIDTESKGACIYNWQKVFLKFLQLRGITQSNLTISSGDVSSPLKVLRKSLKVSQQPKWEFENLFLSPNGGVSSIETW